MSLTREHGCFYYIPYIAITSTCLVGAAIGVATHYTFKCRDSSIAAMDELDVDFTNQDIVEPAIIGTSVAYSVMAFILLLISFWRSFVEGHHDASGKTTSNATAFLVVNALFNSLWWLLVLWDVFFINGVTVWFATAFTLNEAIKNVQAIGGQGVWLPSSGEPCPRNCLDLSVFSFINSSFNDSCVCDQDALEQASDYLQETTKYLPAVYAGVWVMLVAGSWLGINVACQYSHTSRERELLQRTGDKQFIGI